MQNDTRTNKKAPCTFSDEGKLILDVPTSWQELSEEQQRKVLDELGSTYPTLAKTRMVMYFSGIHIKERIGSELICYLDNGHVFIMQTWQWHWLVEKMSFVDSYKGYRPLQKIGSLKPVEELLHDVPFEAYLAMEKYYQGFLRNKKTDLLEKLGRLMYLDGEEYSQTQRFSEGERMNCFLWFANIKESLVKFFPNYFKPAGSSNGKMSQYDILAQMNMQIRALTGGDITKEKEVLKMDCWRALTELDAKALDAIEIKKLRDKNKNKK